MNPTDDGFLGRGWSFPPAFAARGAEVQMVAAEADIEQSLQIILGTRPMERIMQEDFGCDLHDFLFEAMSQQALTGIRQEVTDALLYYEPRIAVDDVDVDSGRLGEGLLLIRVQYRVRSTNTRYNLVYPFFLREATDI